MTLDEAIAILRKREANARTLASAERHTKFARDAGTELLNHADAIDLVLQHLDIAMHIIATHVAVETAVEEPG